MMTTRLHTRRLGLTLLYMLALGLAAGAASAADPIKLDERALQAAAGSSDSAAARAEGKALTAKLAPLHGDARFGPLKAEFEAAAANRDPVQRKAALRAVLDKAAPLRTVPAAAAVAADKRDAPPRITRLSREVAEALGAGSVSIHPSEFDKAQGTKASCGDSSDTFSFPGGDPAVYAISTPAPGDADCELVSAAKYGGKVTVPAGTKSLALTAQLDYTLNADTYALGAWARASSQLIVIAISNSVRFVDGKQAATLSIADCDVAQISSRSSAIEFKERQAKEQNQQISCGFGIAGGSGEVTLGFAVRASIDADLTAVAQADGRLSKIRGVQVALKR
jgi:hypothetical protein